MGREDVEGGALQYPHPAGIIFCFAGDQVPEVSKITLKYNKTSAKIHNNTENKSEHNFKTLVRFTDITLSSSQKKIFIAHF